MNKRSLIIRSSSVMMALTMAFAVNLSAQPAHVHGPSCSHGAAPAQAPAIDIQFEPSEGPVVITSPAPWTTLRSDSLVVSLQADLAKLPKGTIDFKVVRRSGTRSSTLFTKSVKVDEPSADVFLGRVKEQAGGDSYMSIEWSVPGTDLKGTIEPLGIAKLSGEMTADNKWVPAKPPQIAVKLADGISGAQAAEALSGAPAFDISGGMRLWAGWNSTGLFIRFYQTPKTTMTGVDFAFDMKCGKNAFLAWADRFVAYSVAGDFVRGKHFGNRSADSAGMKFEELSWGGNNSPGLEKAGDARVVMIRWPDLGVQPFEERNIGFAVFVNDRQSRSYPAAANRSIPGTWGDLKLAK